MKKITGSLSIIFLALVLLQPGLRAQEYRYDSVKSHQVAIQRGGTTIYADERLDELVTRHVQANRQLNGLQGFRIQIYFGSGQQGREKAYEAKARALSAFPELTTHVIFQYSFYKVRLGDFRTRVEAFPYTRMVKEVFPNAYVVPDVIRYPSLSGD